MRRRRWPAVAGALLVWGALGAAGYVAGWQHHLSRSGAALLAAEGGSPKPSGPCVVSAPQPGQLAGELVVPRLNLTAPVEEGTGDTVLGVAVGHDPSSVWPGETGSAVLLAHDVSYFVHLGDLRPGDRLLYRTACSTTTFEVSGSQVVEQGTPIPQSAGPSLVLATCYPTNALFFTTRRLLVWAKPLGTVPASGTPATPAARSAVPTAFSVPAPAGLVAEGLTLEENEVPMGSMTLGGAPTGAWEQSPGPLNLTAAALEAYFGGLHAAGEGRADWWAAIAQPGVAPPGPLGGAQVAAADSPLDVEIDASGGVPTQVVLRTAVTLSGGPAPGRYGETVTAAVHGSTVLLGGWTLTPG